jgi:hypothetical protein
MVTNASNPVDGFIRASTYMKSFIVSKLERTEEMLREQINRIIKKDGLEVLPGSRFEGQV